MRSLKFLVWALLVIVVGTNVWAAPATQVISPSDIIAGGPEIDLRRFKDATHPFGNLSTAKMSPKTAGKSILISGKVPVNTITIPADRHLRYVNGGKLVLNGTVTQLGSHEAGLFKIYSTVGSGKITFGNKVKQVAPHSWGAKGDDAADDTAPLLAAVATGKPIYLPDGVYKYTSRLVLTTDGQSIIGESRNAILKPAAGVSGIECANSFQRLENFSIKGPALSDTTATTAGVLVTNCTRGLFKFLYIEGFGYGINMQPATLNHVNRIEHCYLYRNGRVGVYGGGHATTIAGGEIAASVYGVLQRKLQAGPALAIDRDYTSDLGTNISVEGVTLESCYETKTVTGAVNNGAGLVRITATGHGFTTGDFISIGGVVGTTEANGVWPITVIDANRFDLKTSSFANGYASGGTAKRGVALYSAVNTAGIRAKSCYFEDNPIVAQFGDAYANDGTTAQTSSTIGGSLESSYSGNTATPSAFAVIGYATGVQITGNYGSGSNQTLINSRGAISPGEIDNWGNYGFTRPYETTGTQMMTSVLIRPATKNNDRAFEVQIPATNGSTTLSTAFFVGNFLGADYTGYFASNVLFNGYLKGATNSGIYFGTGSPEGAVTADPGSIYLNHAGGAATSLYVKQSGTAATGWVGK